MNDWINKVHCGDCLEAMKEMPDNSIDSCVTDPPYGLEFMGKEWDKFKLLDKRQLDYPSCRSINVNEYKAGLTYQLWSQKWAAELYRIIKPGAYLLAFGGTRTEHRLSCGIEDAGFVIRDKICWFYGSGFPKNRDVSKGFDRREGVEREVVGYGKWHNPKARQNWTSSGIKEVIETAPATPLAKQWDGWGTALKPSFEFIVLAQKPLDKNYCHNLEKWGCGAINIDGGRIGFISKEDRQESTAKNQHEDFSTPPLTDNVVYGDYSKTQRKNYNPPGRWPANLILECCCDEVVSEPIETKEPDEIKGGIWKPSQGKPAGRVYKGGRQIHTDPNCPCRLLDEESGELSGPWGKDGAGDLKGKTSIFGFGGLNSQNERRGKESGGASRFFKYIPKADRAEKEAGLRGRLPCVKCGNLNSDTHLNDNGQKVNCVRNDHPTVKPIALFRYLQMMFTPAKGTTIDPFAGSGSSCISAIREGFDYIAIDQDEGYIKIAEARITEETKQLKLF